MCEMDDFDFYNEEIVLYVNGRLQKKKYGEVPLTYEESQVRNLAEWLEDERRKVIELKKNIEEFSYCIKGLNRIYERHDFFKENWFAKWEENTKNIDDIKSYAERRQILRDYYTIPQTLHSDYLDIITNYIFKDAEGDYSENDKLFVRFITDFMCRMLRKIKRKTGVPQAFHLIECARGIAKNGQSVVTIVGALLHDIVEEAVDEFTDELVMEKYPNFKELPSSERKKLRNQVIKENLDLYNDRASGIFYAIGLFMFYHIRKYCFTAKYYQTINTIMEIIARLSRTKDISYYNYIKKLFFPHKIKKDEIEKDALIENIKHYFPMPEKYFNDYIEKVDNFYETSYGEFFSKDELSRNAFREILIKILDRLNNTRDMDPKHYTPAKQLYNAGYKNLYLIQSIESKMKRTKKLLSEEKRIIEIKFLNKIKVAALYQMLRLRNQLIKEVGFEKYKDIEHCLNYEYKKTANFTKVILKTNTATKRFKYSFDGIVETFNRIILGDKKTLDEIDKDPVELLKITLVFKSLFEAFIAVKPFSISGLTPKVLEKQYKGSHKEFQTKLKIKSFNRKIKDSRTVGAEEGEGGNGSVGKKQVRKTKKDTKK